MKVSNSLETFKFPAKILSKNILKEIVIRVFFLQLEFINPYSIDLNKGKIQREECKQTVTE